MRTSAASTDPTVKNRITCWPKSRIPTFGNGFVFLRPDTVGSSGGLMGDLTKPDLWTPTHHCLLCLLVKLLFSTTRESNSLVVVV